MDRVNPRRALATETQPNASDSGPSRETRRRAAVAWEGLKQIFGTSFLTIHGETPSTLWLGKIAELTDEQVNAGLKRVADMKREYPVNLTEFAEACRPKTQVRYLGVRETAEQRTRRIGKVAADREHIEKCLASMRALFGPAREPGCDDEQTGAEKRPVEGCTCSGETLCDYCAEWIAKHG